jgi:hypothetical protein
MISENWYKYYAECSPQGRFNPGKISGISSRDRNESPGTAWRARVRLAKLAQRRTGRSPQASAVYRPIHNGKAMLKVEKN